MCREAVDGPSPLPGGGGPSLAVQRGELPAEAYGGNWSSTEMVLTHRSHELADVPAVVPMDCVVRDAVRRAQEIAGDAGDRIAGDNELDVNPVPLVLGDGTRIFDVPGVSLMRWEAVMLPGGAVTAAGRVYRPRRRLRATVTRDPRTREGPASLRRPGPRTGAVRISGR